MNKENPPVEKKAIAKEPFGVTPDGNKINQYILKNANGMELKVIPYGGRITSLKVPDRNGKLENVVLGLDNLQDYLGENPFLGALIGRYGNRIAKGRFHLGDRDYSLVTNDGENHLHGGNKGFDRVFWDVESDADSDSLRLSYTSPDMEEGYPGTLTSTVVYTLNSDNSLDVTYEATTDKKTIVNLTQHTYFNLSGDFRRKILDHKLKISADAFLPVDKTMIPTGEVRQVEDTPFDFRDPMAPGDHIEDENEQLIRANGYDHNWILNGGGEELSFAASAVHPASGRKLEVFTTEPGMQLYTGNWLDGSLPIPGTNEKYEKRTGFCFETQHYPDSPNHEKFPSVVLEPGEKYSSKTSFRFSVE